MKGIRSKGRDIVAVLALVLTLSGVILFAENLGTRNHYTKYTDAFFDTFDTVVTVVGYAKSREEFNAYFERIHSRFLELHKMFDIYNGYEGMNNLKTVNDNAGIAPVKVSKEIVDLILFSKQWYTATGGKTNIALGAMLRIWHDYRERGVDDPEHAELPPLEELAEAAKHSSIDNVIVDVHNNTVYLADKDMRLDVGAVAKGFATELVARELEAGGVTSVLMSAGGNIRAVGFPLDGNRRWWSVGIHDPRKPMFSTESNLLGVIHIGDGESVATSGGYQRYYLVNGKAYHHIIDPDTLMPANRYLSVTVRARGADVADFLSTTFFVLPYETGRELAKKLQGVDVVWVFPDGTVVSTPGIEQSIGIADGPDAKLR
ncbi:MAG: FAD:protein FMN transferase [Bacillota bacterium]